MVKLGMVYIRFTPRDCHPPSPLQPQSCLENVPSKVGATKGVCPKQQMVISGTTLPILELNSGLTNPNDGLIMI